MTAHEQRRLAALHEYRLRDARAGDELEAVASVAATAAKLQDRAAVASVPDRAAVAA